MTKDKNSDDGFFQTGVNQEHADRIRKLESRLSESEKTKAVMESRIHELEERLKLIHGLVENKKEKPL